jgi:hypothetical protein
MTTDLELLPDKPDDVRQWCEEVRADLAACDDVSSLWEWRKALEATDARVVASGSCRGRWWLGAMTVSIAERIGQLI